MRPRAGQREPGLRQCREANDDQPQDHRQAVPRPGDQTDQERTQEHQDHQQDHEASLTRVTQPVCQALPAAPRGESMCKTIARASGIASAPSASKAPAPPIIVPNRNGLVGLSDSSCPHGCRRCRRAAESQRFAGVVVVGVSRRSSSVGAHGGTATRQIKAVQPIGPVRDLHDRQGRVEQRTRRPQGPRPGRAAQAIGEVGHGPEDPQAG